ncbi:hypothetical protein BC830DRAFT_1135041 [Chytriomyces sp. MP71]|nr:hypothetical protein BC830DRAFT_1135041 [Chytriomyces sp. MP71]
MSSVPHLKVSTSDAGDDEHFDDGEDKDGSGDEESESSGELGWVENEDPVPSQQAQHKLSFSQVQPLREEGTSTRLQRIKHNPDPRHPASYSSDGENWATDNDSVIEEDMDDFEGGLTGSMLSIEDYGDHYGSPMRIKSLGRMVDSSFGAVSSTSTSPRDSENLSFDYPRISGSTHAKGSTGDAAGEYHLNETHVHVKDPQEGRSQLYAEYQGHLSTGGQPSSFGQRRDLYDQMHESVDTTKVLSIPGVSSLSRQSSYRWEEQRDDPVKVPPHPHLPDESQSLFDTALMQNPKALLSKQRSRTSTFITSPTMLHSSVPQAISTAELLTDTDPYLLKLIALTSPQKGSPIISPPPPRSTSLIIPESQYTSESGRTSPFESMGGTSLASGEATPISMNRCLPPNLSNAPNDLPYIPTSFTLARSERVKSVVGTKYSLMLQIFDSGASTAHLHGSLTKLKHNSVLNYNPLAVIRHRREEWQAAVKGKVPSTDIRKLRMAKGGGWIVGNDEIYEYMLAVLQLNAVREPSFVTSQGSSKPKSSALENEHSADRADHTANLSSIQSPIKIIAGNINRFWSIRRREGRKNGKERTQTNQNVVPPHENENVEHQVGQSSKSSALLSQGTAVTSEISVQADDFNYSLQSKPSGEHSIESDSMTGSGHGRQFVNRVRTGTGALNSILGKSTKKKVFSSLNGLPSRNLASRRSSFVSDDGHHIGDDFSQFHAEPTILEESNLLNMFLAGQFGQDHNVGSWLGLEEINEESQHLQKDALQGALEPEPCENELNDQIVPHMTIESGDDFRGRSSLAHTFKAGRHLLRSPERAGYIISNVGTEVGRWIGSVGGMGSGAHADQSGDEVTLSKGKMLPRTLRPGNKSSAESNNIAEVAKDAAKDAVVYLEKKMKVGQSIRQKGKRNRAKPTQDTTPTNDTEFQSRYKEEGKPKDNLVKQWLSVKEDLSISHSVKDHVNERRRSKRLVRVNLEHKTSDTAVQALELISEVESPATPSQSASSHPVMIRKKSSKRFIRKSHAGLRLPDNEDVNSTSEVTGKDAIRDVGDISDFEAIEVDAMPSMSSLYANHAETSLIEAANGVLQLLRLIVNASHKKREFLKVKVDAFEAVASKYDVHNCSNYGQHLDYKDSSSLEQLNAMSLQNTVLRAKFVTHRAQLINLQSSMSKMNDLLSGISQDLEKGDHCIQTMISQMENMGDQINQNSSQRLKTLEDQIQLQDTIRQGPMNSVNEFGYQFLEALLIVLGYVVWILYMGYKGVQHGFLLTLNSKNKQKLINNSQVQEAESPSKLSGQVDIVLEVPE